MRKSASIQCQVISQLGSGCTLKEAGPLARGCWSDHGSHIFVLIVFVSANKHDADLCAFVVFVDENLTCMTNVLCKEELIVWKHGDCL